MLLNVGDLIINLRIMVIEMKHLKTTLLCIACILILTACTNSFQNNYIEEIPVKVLHSQASIRMYETLEQCVEKADYIITCTVSEIGDTFIFGDKEINEDSTPEEINSYIRSICTPVTLDIHDIHYASRDIPEDTMTIILSEGIYNGYELRKNYPEYEKDHTYLLYIQIAPDGETNMIMHQGSVELGTMTASEGNLQEDRTIANEFTPLFNERIYRDFTSIEQVTQCITTYVLE